MKYVSQFGNKYDLTFLKLKYLYFNNLAVEVLAQGEDEYPEPYAMLTVNLPVVPHKGCAFIDTNNCGYLIKTLELAGCITPTGVKAHSGFCEYPEYRFSEDFLSSMIEG